MTVTVMRRRSLAYPRTGGPGQLTAGTSALAPVHQPVHVHVHVQDGLAMPGEPDIENPAAAHQLRIRLDRRSWLTLNCTCGASIDTRSCWATGEASRAWTAWHQREGISL